MNMTRTSLWRVSGAAQDTSDRGGAASSRSIAAVALLLTLSCAGSAPQMTGPDWTPERTQQAEALEAQLATGAAAEAPTDGSLRIRLAFGADADLDLFVTDLDPRVSETVYFAKHKSRAGGRLIRDARCSSELPRSDAIVYGGPHTGAGYRIGVDYHRSCGERPDFSVFVVEWMSGAKRQTRRGIARPGQFDDRFWMLETSEFTPSAN